MSSTAKSNSLASLTSSGRPVSASQHPTPSQSYTLPLCPTQPGACNSLACLTSSGRPVSVSPNPYPTRSPIPYLCVKHSQKLFFSLSYILRETGLSTQPPTPLPVLYPTFVSSTAMSNSLASLTSIGRPVSVSPHPTPLPVLYPTLLSSTAKSYSLDSLTSSVGPVSVSPHPTPSQSYTLPLCPAEPRIIL